MELVVVIILLGILAAVAAPRLSGGMMDERGLRDNTVAALRYAQKSAIAARRHVCVAFPSATQVNFTIMTAAADTATCPAGAALPGPGGGSSAVAATGAAQFSPVPAGFSFSPMGRPSFAASQTIQVTAAQPITVEAETGYVH